jgi:predicted peptidase
MKILISLLGTVLVAGCASTQPGLQPAMQTPQKFETTLTRKVKLNYLLFLPADYSVKSRKQWPLMLFLHGAGERGTNLTKVTVHGPPKFLPNKPGFPFIVVSPQCPTGERWEGESLLALVDDVMAKYKVDPARVYVTGLSMGGYGTWTLASEAPKRFAAIVPICGGGQTIPIALASKEKRDAMKTLGVWAFHGAKDPVVKLEESEKMVAAFKQIGNQDVKLTVYPEATHDSWTETYDNPELYDWLLEHKRSD